MKFSHLTIAIASSIAIMNVANAAGLEKSTQPVDILFAKGNKVEVTQVFVTPSIEAKDRFGQDASNMIEDYSMTEFGIKIAPTEKSAIAVLYSQPWGVDTSYQKGNMFNNELGATQAHVATDSISLLGGHKVGDSNFTIYGGLDYQTITGNVKAAVPLGAEKATESAPAILAGVLSKVGVSQAQYAQLAAGAAAGALDAATQVKFDTINGVVTENVTKTAMSSTLYDLKFEEANSVVPVIGVAFEKPEIMLRAALTYRAPARYEISGLESLTVAANSAANIKDFKGTTAVNFPQSVNLDFQTGLSAKHQLLGTFSARWVDWSAFDVAPPLNNQLQKGKPLVSYDHDQYSVSLGLGKQITQKFAGRVGINYDYAGPSDASLTALGPYGSVTGLSLGGQYDVTDALSIGGGAQYMMIDGGVVESNDPEKPSLTVEDSDGYALGLNVGYNF